jgi:hypothetical protein
LLPGGYDLAMATGPNKRVAGLIAWVYRFDSYFIVGTLSSLYFLGLARLNPDPHHDGVQFAAATGVAHGLKIHSEVYEQYGPLTAWVQGATLKIFGATLLNLRLENVVLLTIAALLLLRILFILGVPNYAAMLVSLVWAVSCPASSIYPGVFGFWPWSSVYSLVLLLANAAVLLNSRIVRKSLSAREIYFLGATCAAILFIRFQVGIVVSIVNLVLILLSDIGRPIHQRTQRVRKFIYTFLVSISYFVAFLYYQGSLSSFVDQIIVGPLHQYLYPYNWPFFRIYYIWAGLPTIALLFIATIGWRKFGASHKYFIIAFVALFMSGLVYYGNWHNGAQLNRTNTSRALLDVQGISFLFTSVLISLILGFFAVAFLFTTDFLHPLLAHPSSFGKLARTIYKSFNKGLPGLSSMLTPAHKERRNRLAILGTLLLLLLPFLIQLYPLADVYHLWWAAPLFMVLIPYSLMNFVSREGVNAIIASIVVPALVASSVMYLNLIRVPRTEITQGAMKGMEVEAQYIPSYTNIAGILQSVQPNSARFYCADGLLSTWNGTYLSIDAAYVSWAWVAKNPPTVTVPSRIFLCTTQAVADNFAKANNGHLVGPGVPYYLSYWSGGIFFEFATN